MYVHIYVSTYVYIYMDIIQLKKNASSVLYLIKSIFNNKDESEFSSANKLQ